MSIAIGPAAFIWQVTIHGNIHLLSPTLTVGKLMDGQYVKFVWDMQRAQLTFYVKEPIFRRWTDPFLKHEPTSVPLSAGTSELFDAKDVLSVRSLAYSNKLLNGMVKLVTSTEYFISRQNNSTSSFRPSFFGIF